MSASSTPTVKPLAARPAARLTDIDDLPTPPLPEETASTRALGGTVVLGACSRAFQRARAITAAFCSRPISLVSTSTERDPGQSAHPPGDFCLDLAPERAGRRREGDADHDDAARLQLDRVHHFELDDVVAQLGVDHGAQRIAHRRLGERASQKWWALGGWPCTRRRRNDRCFARWRPISLGGGRKLLGRG